MKRLLYVLLALLSPLLMGQGYSGGTSTAVPAGTGSGTLAIGGELCKGAPAATTTGTTEQVLATCRIPANTLNANGMAIRFSYFAHSLNNGNNKQLRVRIGGIGGTLVLDSTAIAMNDQNWINPLGLVTRTGATTATSVGANWCVANASAGALTGGSSFYYFVRAAAITWANANDLVITATTPTAAGDLTLDSYVVEVVQ